MNSTETIIRKGKKEDLPGVLKLIKELALFEKAPEQVINTVSEMEKDGFGTNPVFLFHVALIENDIVGIAVYFIKYSTWRGKGLYLDDLIVTEKHRGKGIGKKLFDTVIEEAKKINARQMHWQVLDWNTPAIEFYKKYGASIDAEWLDCKLQL
jgi:GNAT superfamily N-acetyltransferase